MNDMNRPDIKLVASTETQRPLLAYSAHGDQARWLSSALSANWSLRARRLDPVAELPDLVQQMAGMDPRLVLLDFSDGQAARSGEITRLIAQRLPGVPVIAVGVADTADIAVAAMRAGVKDFIDTAKSADDARHAVQRVLAQSAVTQIRLAPTARTPEPAHDGRVITLLGARPGMGTSTIAAQLAVSSQQRLGSRGRVLLLDLGTPIGDASLYLDSNGEFDFAEALRNLRRLDQTLVESALVRHASGVSVLPLPRRIGELREMSQSDVPALLQKLKLCFDLILVDLGGLAWPEFTAEVVRASDTVWWVTDQSVGALVSLAELKRDLAAKGVETASGGLIVNKYDTEIGMNAAQIAARFELPLLARLPARARALLDAATRGKLIGEVRPRDPWLRSLQPLLARLQDPAAETAGTRPAGLLARWRGWRR
jgi:pilus assembly protein CpaE